MKTIEAGGGEYGKEDAAVQAVDVSGEGSQKIWLTCLRRVGLAVVAAAGGVIGAYVLGAPAFLFSDGIARLVENESFRRGFPPVATVVSGAIGLGMGAFYGWALSLLGFTIAGSVIDKIRGR